MANVLLTRALSSWFRVGPLPDPESSSPPDPEAGLCEAQTLPQEKQMHPEVSAGDSNTDTRTATRTSAGGASPLELVLIVAPEPLPGQHQQQRWEALQREGTISISSGSFQEKDGLHENAGGGSPPAWAQVSEPPQSRSVELLPTFTSQRPADLPTMTPAPAATSRTSEHR